MHIAKPQPQEKMQISPERLQNTARALKCVNKKAILKFSNVHNFWNEMILNARRRILEVDTKAQTRRRQSRRYRKKAANDSGSINQCFSATAIANIKKMQKKIKILFYRPTCIKKRNAFNKCKEGKCRKMWYYSPESESQQQNAVKEVFQHRRIQIIHQIRERSWNCALFYIFSCDINAA